MDNLLLIASIAYILFRDRGLPKNKISIKGDTESWHKGRTVYPALLSEYYPDTPNNQSAKVKRREGGSVDTHGKKLITISEHESDNVKFPYVSVSADIILDGQKVPYGSRIYFMEFPSLVFRIVDTGDNFRWDKNKQIKKPGHEPFDIAVNWANKGSRIAGLETWYALDMTDNLERKRSQTS